jgi:hypothetical protein
MTAGSPGKGSLLAPPLAQALALEAERAVPGRPLEAERAVPGRPA